MGSSFITKDEINGFWVRDSIMCVACWGLVETIDDMSLSRENFWLKVEFRDLIFNNSQGIFVGWMHLRLNKFLTNKSRVILFTEIISKTREFFLDKGEFIPLKELNSFQFILNAKINWGAPIKVSYVNTVLRLLYDVVNDKINTVIQLDDDIWNS